MDEATGDADADADAAFEAEAEAEAAARVCAASVLSSGLVTLPIALRGSCGVRDSHTDGTCWIQEAKSEQRSKRKLTHLRSHTHAFLFPYLVLRKLGLGEPRQLLGRAILHQTHLWRGGRSSGGG